MIPHPTRFWDSEWTAQRRLSALIVPDRSLPRAISEARLDVEILDTEVQTQKAGLKAVITSLKCRESGIRPVGGPGGGVESAEEQKKITDGDL